jgi:hypothetical protein
LGEPLPRFSRPNNQDALQIVASGAQKPEELAQQNTIKKDKAKAEKEKQNENQPRIDMVSIKKA